MKIFKSFLSFLFLILFLSGCDSITQTVELRSPDGRLKVEISLNQDGKLFYSVFFDNEQLLINSKLGLVMEDSDFSENLSFKDLTSAKRIEESYKLITGKKVDHYYLADETVLSFLNNSGEQMDLIVRLSDNGFAYRYFFPGNSNEIKYITEELSSFNFPAGTLGWLSPMAVAKTGWESSNPSYEEYYEYGISAGSPSPLGAGWVYPALFRYNDIWMLISEADLHRNYCGTRLEPGEREYEYKVGFPDEREVIFNSELKPESTLPWLSPWRLMAVGSLADIVESTLGTDLAAPSLDMDFSWVKPGYASWSWIMYKDESVNYKTSLEYIDFASAMNWEYCLIDVNWDRNIGYDGIKELAAYAKLKKVKLILWYNSAGDWNTTPYTPRGALLSSEQRRKEFERLSEMGIAGVKVDFFGGDGQSVIEYYHDIFKDAAEYQLTVNCHGATLPRGWHRTYPNLVTIEAVKGMEFVTFEQENANEAPRQNTMQVFSRNVFDPMDYTPMNLTGKIQGINRITTSAHELALPLLFTSGIQHLAETPEGVDEQALYVKDFLKSLPTKWLETKFIDGFPGEYAVLAKRAENAWYILGINGIDAEVELNLKLDFLSEEAIGNLIIDGSLANEFDLIETNNNLSLTMKPNGGFVAWFPVE